MNVFDFLVPSDSPNASKSSLVPETRKSKKGGKMDYSPSLVGSEISSKQDTKLAPRHDPDYDTKGFSYGADPIPTSKKRDRERPTVEYFTPAPKDLARDLERHLTGRGHAEEYTSQKSTDKKRKRHSDHPEGFELARRPSREASEDAVMSDAPPASSHTPSFHTGLTGGLNRLLSKDEYFDEDDNRYKDTPAPSRSRPSQTYIVKESRAHPESSKALVQTANRRSSDESRPRKHHRSHRTSEYHDEGTITTTSSTRRHRKRSKHRSPSTANTATTKRSVRAIEYHPDGDEQDTEQQQQQQQQQMVVYKARAAFFMSFVTKGPESETGTSMNKALKRYHRERGERGREKEEEEKELWKGLRLKKNERGEVVVFF